MLSDQRILAIDIGASSIKMAEFGALDAAILIPSGSTKQFVKGRRGLGIPRTEGREKRV